MQTRTPNNKCKKSNILTEQAKKVTLFLNLIFCLFWAMKAFLNDESKFKFVENLFSPPCEKGISYELLLKTIPDTASPSFPFCP